MMPRIFLSAVGVAYIILAAWCAIMPQRTSKAVGFALQPGSGQSEFLTVYGGLEFALGIVLLWPLFKPAEIAFPLLVCLIVHGSLVLFRTVGFFLYSGIPTTTYVFAAAEWTIFLGAGVLYWMRQNA